MDIHIPRYADATRPHGIVPPSPPAEQRQRRYREIRREVPTYRDRWPDGRILLPGMPFYEETVRQYAMPAGSPCVGNGTPIDKWAGIVAYWTMDEASGTRVDTVAGNNNLSVTGTVAQQTGQLGSAAGAFSTSNYLSRASTSDLVLHGHGWGFTFWLYAVGWTGTSGNYDTILSKGRVESSANMEYYLVRFTNDSGLYFGASTNGTSYQFPYYTLLGGGGFVPSGWTFVYIGSDGSNMRFQNDSSAFSGGAYAGANPYNGNNDFRVGIYGAGSPSYVNPFNGYIDGMAVFGAQPSDAAVTSIYNGGAGVDYPN